MKRQALETMAYQLDRFDSLSPKLQEELLKTTMEDLDKEVSGVKDMAQAWAFGNVAAMEKMTLDDAAGSAGAVSTAARRAQSQLDPARRDVPQTERRLLHRRRRRAPRWPGRPAGPAREEGLQGHPAVELVPGAECRCRDRTRRFAA